VTARATEVVRGLIVSSLLATAAFMLADSPFFRDTLRGTPLQPVILLGMALGVPE
jgi:hypothetical protein